GQDLILNAFSKVSVIRIAAEVFEREHCNRFRGYTGRNWLLRLLEDFLEAWIIPQRIEHWIETEQCRSQRSGRAKRSRIRCRQKLLQSSDGAIGFSCLHCHSGEKLNRSGASYSIFLDRIHSHSPLRER